MASLCVFNKWHLTYLGAVFQIYPTVVQKFKNRFPYLIYFAMLPYLQAQFKV